MWITSDELKHIRDIGKKNTYIKTLSTTPNFTRMLWIWLWFILLRLLIKIFLYRRHFRIFGLGENRISKICWTSCSQVAGWEASLQERGFASHKPSYHSSSSSIMHGSSYINSSKMHKFTMPKVNMPEPLDLSIRYDGKVVEWFTTKLSRSLTKKKNRPWKPERNNAHLSAKFYVSSKAKNCNMPAIEQKIDMLSNSTIATIPSGTCPLEPAEYRRLENGLSVSALNAVSVVSFPICLKSDQITNFNIHNIIASGGWQCISELVNCCICLTASQPLIINIQAQAKPEPEVISSTMEQERLEEPIIVPPKYSQVNYFIPAMAIMVALTTVSYVIYKLYKELEKTRLLLIQSKKTINQQEETIKHLEGELQIKDRHIETAEHKIVTLERSIEEVMALANLKQREYHKAFARVPYLEEVVDKLWQKTALMDRLMPNKKLSPRWKEVRKEYNEIDAYLDSQRKDVRDNNIVPMCDTHQLDELFL